MSFSITTTIIDNQFEIKIENTDGVTTTYAAFNKKVIEDVAIEDDLVVVYMCNTEVNDVFKFDYTKVTAPVCADAVTLYNAINVMINNRP